MADLAAIIPDGQLEAFDIHIGGNNAAVGDRVTAVNAWFQTLINQELWAMARTNALNSVSDPTV
jgi:hypothetical protein